MTQEQIIVDARAALIDARDRSAWWRRRGFRRLDFPYVQPPLSAAQEPCSYLDYFIRAEGDGAATIASVRSVVLLEHLRRFFFVSVGKFAQDMASNREWLAVRDLLSRCDLVNIV